MESIVRTMERTGIYEESYNISNKQMNFYKIWYIFRELPKVYIGGKSGNLNGLNLYEYEIYSEGKRYEIYSWSENFLKAKDWIIQTTGRKNEEFLKKFEEKIREYERYRSMERKIFTDKDKEINKVLNEIKNEIVKNKETLKMI
jgi:hypothetical protein